MIGILDENYFKYSGRILEKDGAAYLGFTNSKVEFYVKGNNSQLKITADIGTTNNGEENEARLKVYVDDADKEENLLILSKESAVYTLAELKDTKIHKITLIKITEAAMSYARLNSILVTDGDLVKLPTIEDNRIKVEFLGDSITCGYGVYGEPNSEYHISEEDGMVTYASLTAKELNLNARYFSVSGYGVFVKYDGDPEGIIPKVYPYTNYFVDETIKYDFKDFIPAIFVINLGTNDSGHLDKEDIQKGFISNYAALLHFLKSYAPQSKILCICGTLCTTAFAFIEKAVKQVTEAGLKDIYTMELPYHDVETDGLASGHPTIATHKKDAKRLTEKIKEIMSL
jgi:hypothetical protein